MCQQGREYSVCSSSGRQAGGGGGERGWDVSLKPTLAIITVVARRPRCPPKSAGIFFWLFPIKPPVRVAELFSSSPPRPDFQWKDCITVREVRETLTAEKHYQKIYSGKRCQVVVVVRIVSTLLRARIWIFDVESEKYSGRRLS